jgi:hypothetical protein
MAFVGDGTEVVEDVAVGKGRRSLRG